VVTPGLRLLIGSARSRYVPKAERQKVLLRDQNRCTYQDPETGRRCGSRHGLQLDHVVPFSLGGANTADNLTLRCGPHNRYRAEQMGLARG
jgi:5-methylcytosine-specific restriction endonuclease McrA